MTQKVKKKKTNKHTKKYDRRREKLKILQREKYFIRHPYKQAESRLCVGDWGRRR